MDTLDFTEDLKEYENVQQQDLFKLAVESIEKDLAYISRISTEAIDINMSDDLSNVTTKIKNLIQWCAKRIRQFCNFIFNTAGQLLRYYDKKTEASNISTIQSLIKSGKELRTNSIDPEIAKEVAKKASDRFGLSKNGLVVKIINQGNLNVVHDWIKGVTSLLRYKKEFTSLNEAFLSSDPLSELQKLDNSTHVLGLLTEISRSKKIFNNTRVEAGDGEIKFIHDGNSLEDTTKFLVNYPNMRLVRSNAIIVAKLSDLLTDILDIAPTASSRRTRDINQRNDRNIYNNVTEMADNGMLTTAVRAYNDIMFSIISIINQMKEVITFFKYTDSTVIKLLKETEV